MLMSQALSFMERQTFWEEWVDTDAYRIELQGGTEQHKQAGIPYGAFDKSERQTPPHIYI